MITRQEKQKKLTQKINKEEKIEKTKTKGKKMIKILLVLFVLVSILFYYMKMIEPNFLITKEIKITNENIPISFHGLKIVHISDLHYKSTINKKNITKIINEINKLKPDILVFTGDLLDTYSEINENDINDLITSLKNIKVTMNKYYIKGNHDYKQNVDTIFNQADFISLNNKEELIYKDKEYISISGYGSSIKDDFIVNNDELDSPYKIVLIHEPDNINNLLDKNYDLALAGHSHNLQIGIPYIRTLFKRIGCVEYYNNHYKVNNTELYVNAGLGTNNYKLRLLAPPTINFYRLTTK